MGNESNNGKVPLILCIFTTILRSNFQQSKKSRKKTLFSVFSLWILNL